MTQPELAGMPAPRVMSERELLSATIDTARLFGWRVAHFRSVPVKRGPRVVWETPVQGDGAGFPDLVLVRRESLLWIELKVGANTLSAPQVEWARALDAAGQERYIWTEHDWFDGVIESRLRRV